jgi:hypothetical protein
MHFGWGIFDCVIWAALCIDAQCGTDIVQEWRGCYASERHALGLLRDRGWDSLAAAASHYMGEPFDQARFARDGDVIWIMRHKQVMPFGHFGTLLVVNGPRVLGVSHNGLIGIPRADLLKRPDTLLFGTLDP